MKKPFKKGSGFQLPETPAVNRGFKKNVTGACLDNLDDPNEEHPLNIGERGYCKITVLHIEKTAEEINRLYKYNKMMGKDRCGDMGYVFED